ncbi:MAG: hypothetical protein A2998_01945 [Candidatus Staskawiczbacteria bacterium RIFCSPLOWO2_01_FULL_37_25b]|uniref:Uncharacterized protein n=1 Tax=Candidatus Staskawiczbacteria bacterium RIFCSPLOWO2_01_FULL_37_25b TaxID=1802213 RepID=A0A1G2I984_9BACT|nr:MAG: hypothetical protein A2998_01945 [Candidatus Staskawiczbacteria bacterium RIFCSPLOWO2_01_FULL_37_25b]
MTEKIEPNLQAKEFNSDKERLEFLEKNIVEHIQNAISKFRELFQKDLDERIKELGIDPTTQQQSVKNQKKG